MEKIQYGSATRLKYNELILRKLERAIKENPDLRFIQALWAIGLIDSDSQRDEEGRFKVIDRFFEESVTTWERIRRKHKFEQMKQ